LKDISAVKLDPTTWVDAHGDYLYRYALARVKNADTAEELVQETLLAALAARQSFQGRSTERSWLTAILKRKVVDWLRETLRQRANHEPMEDRSAESLFTRAGKWNAKPLYWSADETGNSLEQSEFREVLAACLGKIPPRLRHAFVLWHLDEQPTDEICKAIGATANNLGVMLYRARLRMSQCLTLNWFEPVSEARSGAQP
jgi:RNA polymerase sigma-70 factor (TIGR02943 family)